MLDIFQSGLETTVAIILALGILVGIHEWGHYIVARLCGVKVLKFSIGFGKSLYSWVDKEGTEFVIAWIPLGGFVKMVDEREGDVAEEDLPYAFNRKPPSQRIAIVAAGPFINLFFAAVIYTIIAMGTQQVLAPVVGTVESESLAELAGIKVGDEIVAVEGKAVTSWDDVVQSLVLKVLEPGEIELTVQRGDDMNVEPTSEPALINSALDAPIDSPKLVSAVLDLTSALSIDENTDILKTLGIQPDFPKLPPLIGELVPGEAAERDGFLVGDQILSVAGEKVSDWSHWVELVKANPETDLLVTFFRNDVIETLVLRPQQRFTTSSEGVEEAYGFVGVAAGEFDWPEHLVKTIKHGPVDALVFGFQRTWNSAELILVSTWKLAVGDLSKDNLGGPIMIAKLAGRYAQQGIEPYLLFIAYISIVLGVMNLLPIPVLDGGHILFYSIELIVRRPIPEKIQEALMKVGLAILLTIMSFAFYNDISNIVAG